MEFEESDIKKIYVQDILERAISNQSNTVVYACRNQNMINELNEICYKKGVTENQIFNDAFVVSNWVKKNTDL